MSFSRAARILGVRQSAVSRRVQALEDELGVSLFERNANGVRVTQAGRRFLDRTRLVFADIDHAVKSAGDAGRGADGVVRVGILASMASGFLRELLSDYRAAHPMVAVDLVEGSAREHIARIGERRLDVAFVIGAPLVPDCDSETLWTARIFAALPESHPLADREELGWEALKDEHFIVSRDAIGPDMHNHIVKRQSEQGRNPSVERYGVGREALMHMVALGFGVSLVSETAVATRYPEVVFRPLANSDDEVSYSAVWLPGNDNPALRRFLSLARSKSAGRPSPPAPESSS